MHGYEDLNQEQLVQLVFALTEQLKAANEQIAALKEQLGGGPGPTPPTAKALPAWVRPNRPDRKKTERKKRDCAFSRPRSESTRELDHAPEHCPDCGRALSGGTLHHTREVIDLPRVQVEVVEHRFHTRWCGVCQKQVRSKSDLSSEALGKSRIGIRLMSLVAYLRTQSRLPVRSIQALLLAQFGLKLSEGEICGILHRIARQAEPLVRSLRDKIRASPYVHADETGWREDGKNGYLWSFSTPDTRYYVRDPSRSSRVVREALGEDFAGILITDFYSAYSYHLGEHQRCWVHLLRDMHDLVEKHPSSESVKSFVRSVRELFDRARAYKHRNPRERRKERSFFQDELRAIGRAFLKRDVPQRLLAQRLENFAHELFAFVEYEGVPPDNNPAERAIRPAVIARKISGGTRTRLGSDTTSTLRSLFATWQLRNHDPLECCRLLLTGKLNAAGDPA